MFTSALKVWSFNPNEALKAKGEPYSGMSLTNNTFLNIEFRPQGAVAVFTEFNEGKSNPQHSFNLTNTPPVFEAIRQGKIADEYTEQYLLQFIKQQALSAVDGQPTKFREEFFNMWPEYAAFLESEQRQIQEVANAMQQRLAKQQATASE